MVVSLLLGLLSLLWLPLWSQAATYYVTLTGNDTTGTGSVGTPWRTIQKAATTASAGDTVSVGAGTFYERIVPTNSGSAGAPITYQGTRDGSGNLLTTIDGSDALTGWTLDTATCGAGCYKATPLFKAYWLGVDTGAGLQEIIRGKDASWLNVPDPYIMPLQYTGYNVNYWEGFGAVWLGTGAFTDFPGWSGGANPGNVWVRFRTGASPATVGTMRVSYGAPVVDLTNKSYLTVQYFRLQGARYGIWLKGDTTGNSIAGNILKHGSSPIAIEHADNWALRNNTITRSGYGWAGYTAGAFNKWSEGIAQFAGVTQPLGSEAYQAAVREKLWEWPNKGTFENSVMVQMEYCAGCTGGEISGNDLSDWPGELIAFSDVSNGTIFNNYLHNSCSSPILPVGNYSNIRVYDNLVRDTNINLRLQSMELAAALPKQLYYYRNRHILDNGRGSHLYVHWGRNASNQLMPTGIHDLWFYHNSFTGGLDGIQLSPDGSLGDLLSMRFLNNILDTAYVWADAGTGVALGHFAYNRVGGLGPSTSPWPGADHPGNTVVALTGGAGFWTAGQLPTMALPASSTARGAGLDIAHTFTINGHTFAALPGFTPGYFSGAAPDLGAVQFATGAPVASNGTPRGFLPGDTTSLVFTVTTDVAATCKYAGVPGLAYDTMPGIFATTGGTVHSTPSGGLTDPITQTWYVRCRDALGNTALTDYSFGYTIDSRTVPFASTSFWNADIAAGAIRKPLGLSNPENPAAVDIEAVGVLAMATGDPLHSVGNSNGDSTLCNGTSGSTAHFSVRLPDAFTVTSRVSNGIWVFCNTTGTTIGSGSTALATGYCRDQYQFERCTAGSDAAGSLSTHNSPYALTGDGGTESDGGHVDSGLHALGGIIRDGELAAADGTGLAHALKIAISQLVLYHSDTIGRTSSWRWPARTSDATWASYSGTDPDLVMGSLVTLPLSVNCATDLPAGTTLGRTLCNTLRQKGGFIVGTYSPTYGAWGVGVERQWTGSAVVGMTEQQASTLYGITMIPGSIAGASAQYKADMQWLLRALAVVTNNSAAAPKGPTEPTLVSCTVYDGAASTVETCYNNPLTAPLIPATGVTGVSVTKNGSADAVTATVRKTGSTVCFQSTVTSAFTAGEPLACTYTPSSGNLTSSGATATEVAAVTDFPGVNQVAAPAVGTLAQRQLTCELAEYPEYFIPWDRCKVPSGLPLRLRGQLLVTQAVTGAVVKLRCSDDAGSTYYDVPVGDGTKRINYTLDTTVVSRNRVENRLDNGGNTFVNEGRVYTAQTAGDFPTLGSVPAGSVLEYLFVVQNTGAVGQASRCKITYDTNADLEAYTVGPKTLTIEALHLLR